MAFTAKDVQALREKTGVGMMDCKKALVETDGDMEKAVDILREKGLASAAKKAGRIAAEGVVVAYYDEDKKVASLVEVNCETDFVAQNKDFVALANRIAKTVADKDPADVDALLTMTLSDSDETVESAIQELFLAIRENMKLRRFARVEGIVSTYIHGGGTVGVLVNFDTDLADKDEFKVMGKDVAMQIAAMNPSYLDEASVPAEVIEHEKEILKAQMKEDPKMAGKPDKVLEGIIAGKIKKYYKENCLVEQEFVKDNKLTVSGYVDSVAKSLGGTAKITGFTRFAKGEGLEKRSDNFAEEIAGMVK